MFPEETKFVNWRKSDSTGKMKLCFLSAMLGLMDISENEEVDKLATSLPFHWSTMSILWTHDCLAFGMDGWPVVPFHEKGFSSISQEKNHEITLTQKNTT